LIIFSNYFIPLLLRYRQLVKSKKHGKGYLCLTYDDGPDEHLTCSLVNLLTSEQAKSTFFLVGFRAERYPGVCRSLLESKQEIGCHTFRHSHQWRQAPWKVLADIRSCYEKLSKWFSPQAPFRPPRGKTHLLVIAWLSLMRIKVVWWTHDSGDTWSNLPNPDDVVSQIRSDRGGIVLLHSFHKDPVRQQYVVELTRRLLNLAKEEHLTICSASMYLDLINSH
jgi:peptidoglycan/xylan/chitin deacetylase (PgdA/CDA1 family)